MFDKIPDQLKALHQWVCWQAIPDDSKPGKIKKVPINAKNGKLAQSNNPDTWCDFKTAAAAAARFSGIGFMFSGSGYFGVDLDGCFDEKGGLSDQALDICETLDAYTEISQSGRGLHMIASGHLPPGARRKGHIEMYESGRFFVMTGNVYQNHFSVGDRTAQAAIIHQKYLAPIPASGIVRPLQATQPASADSDTELLAKMFSAKNGAAVAALWDGDISAYGGDDSRADSALVMHLLFWTHGDTERTDRLFRQSALMRDKWDEKHGAQTYGELTIQKAAAAKATSAIQQDFAPIAINVSTGKSGSIAADQQPQNEITVINPLSDERHYGWNDMGVGALFADTYKNIARYTTEAESWYVYDGHVWKIDTGGLQVAEYAKALVRYMITCAAGITDDDKRGKYMKFLTKMNNNKARNAMLESAKSVYPIALSAFDKDPYLFNCKNGTFDLRHFKLLPHRASDFLSKIVNVEYRPGVTCSRWDDFVDEIMECDTEKAAYLQTAIGYGLTGLQNQKCFFILHGQKTNNGKSTFMDTILHIMGDYAKAAQADVITSKQFARDSSAPSEDVARLWGSRLVSMAEPDKSARLNVGLLKQLTGNDPVTARFLRQNSFQFVPQFKIFLHANDLPQTTDDTIFSSGRVKVIEFNREFKPDEQDKTLSSDFRQSENASGIFNWMLEGTRMFLCQGLHDPVSVQAAVAAYRAESDIIGTFIDDCLKPDPKSNKLVTTVYQKYQTWCSTCGYQPLSLKNLTRELRRKLVIQHGRNGNFISGYSIDNTYFARQDFPVSYN